MNRGYIRFKRAGVVSIVVVYLLILAGGIVRSSGSGMGCPDWPRCFGRIIPPTDESQLPGNYQEIYKNHGYGTEKFNPVKTWIEYVNRLLGALTGICVLVLFILSFVYKNKDDKMIQLSGLVLLLVIIEGIIGKYVVSTNLKPIMVSVHMWGSIVIILLLIYLVFRTNKDNVERIEVSEYGLLQKLVIGLIALTVIQVIIGTQVRQDIDIISVRMDNSARHTWIDQLGKVFYIHRSFSILLFITHLFFIFKLRVATNNQLINKVAIVLFSLLLVEIIAGVLMNYWDIPAVVQPIHMLLGSVILGVQFFILIILNHRVEEHKVKNVNS